jgi:hypothetical protein
MLCPHPIETHPQGRPVLPSYPSFLNAEVITIPDFKLHYRAMVTKSGCYWHKNRQEDKWNRTQDTDTNPCNYSYLIFDKFAQNRHWRKDILFNKWC